VGAAQIQSSIEPNSKPTLLYNGMIHPLIPYAFRGAIWYQGESNAGQAYQYRDNFPLLIQDWREKWGSGDFPFLFVQLANFMQPAKEPGESAWAELREAQSMTLSLPNTGQAVIIDIGEADDIHPRNKQDVGYRLSLAARRIAHRENLVSSGPIYESMKIVDDKVQIKFAETGSGLISRGTAGTVQGFTLAGPDRKFYPATAMITSGHEVVVYTKRVTNPVAVRYGWADNPNDVNLYNREGLPACPFRTDDWPGTTEGQFRVFP
jgi:sialate O-acetylesterase